MVGGALVVVVGCEAPPVPPVVPVVPVEPEVVVPPVAVEPPEVAPVSRAALSNVPDVLSKVPSVFPSKLASVELPVGFVEV